jgi:hypothetical protein
VLYGCETWSLTLKKECRLRVFEKMILRRIFGPKRMLHNEELHSLDRSPNILRVIKSRRLRWIGHVARMEEGRGVFKILTGKLKGKGPLGRPRRRGRTILEWTLKKYISIRGIGLIRLRIGIIGESL